MYKKTVPSDHPNPIIHDPQVQYIHTGIQLIQRSSPFSWVQAWGACELLRFFGGWVCGVTHRLSRSSFEAFVIVTVECRGNVPKKELESRNSIYSTSIYCQDLRLMVENEKWQLTMYFVILLFTCAYFTIYSFMREI